MAVYTLCVVVASSVVAPITARARNEYLYDKVSLAVLLSAY
jgi:hypothetical protein